jgi:hypothetical protein
VKSPEPIFTTSEVTSVYGPGHNSFTVDEHGPLPLRLSPLDAPDTYITHAGTQVALADPLHIETSQFRLRHGLAGKETTSFEALDAPGRFLRATAAGASLAASDGSPAFAAQASFRRSKGLADARVSSWESVATRRAYLSHDGDTVRLATIDAHGARASATFLLL